MSQNESKRIPSGGGVLFLLVAELESWKVALFSALLYSSPMALVTIKNKYQIVIPAKVRKEAGLNVGDFLKARVEKKGEIIFAAQAVVNREKWAHLPKGVQEGLEDIHAGRVSGPFTTHKALMLHLKAAARRYRRASSKRA